LNKKDEKGGMGLGPVLPFFVKREDRCEEFLFAICRLCVAQTERKLAGMLLGAIMELNRREKPEQRQTDEFA
jgi:hypothetical protein